MPFAYLREEARSGRMNSRLMAIVANGAPGRVYLSPTPEMEQIARRAQPRGVPDTTLPERALGFRVQQYGMLHWRDLFTPRQLVALTTFSDLVGEAIQQIRRDAVAADLPDDDCPVRDGGIGARAYGEAVAVYLAFPGRSTCQPFIEHLWVEPSECSNAKCICPAGHTDGLGLR